MENCSIKKIENGNLNDVYLLIINNNKFIIRVSQNINSFEVNALKCLNKDNLNIPLLLGNMEYNDKFITILKYIDGIEPNELNYQQLESLAVLVKKINNIIIDDLKNVDNQPIENIEKLKDYFNVSKNSEYLKAYKSYFSEMINLFSTIQFNKLGYSLIHSDIKKTNMLVNGNDVYLIDFGNCYLGSRIIEIVRIIMWLFLKDGLYDFDKISFFVKKYFEDNQITEDEEENLSLLIRFCLSYNVIKDVYLYENMELDKQYIELNDLKWIEILKNEQLLNKIEEVIKNVSRCSQK